MIAAARAALFLAGTELRRRFRDLSAVSIAFIGPVVLAGILGLALGGIGGFRLRMAVADEDNSTVSKAFVARVLSQPQLREGVVPVPVASGREARRQVTAGESPVGLVVPRGFEASLAGTQPRPVTLIRRVDRPISAAVGQSVADAFAAGVDSGRLAVQTAFEGIEARPDDIKRVSRQAAEAEPPVHVATTLLQPRENLIAYFGPSIAILALFFSLGNVARNILAERESGTLERLQASPVPLAALLAAKVMALLVLGFLSMLTMWGVTTVGFGASWGHPGAVAALCWAAVVAMGGCSALLSTLVAKAQRAEAVTAMVAFSLALLGGNFFPPANLPAALVPVTRLTPNGMALGAFHDQAFGGAAPGAIVGPVAGLIAIGAVSWALAALNFRRSVVR